ncbi:MAG TPA: glycoside hydrolase family 15 protein [Candidatus Paceibacterota bacterium]|nr:glycoside hydrolase family 15 protein [Candidatus Paceibacterota bacterium]
MARSIILGNGNMLVGLDEWANVRDLYFPMVGLENHVGEHMRHRIGVWADGKFSWLHDGTWTIKTHLEDAALESSIEATHAELGVSLFFHDVVYNEKNIFIRAVEVNNLADQKRSIRVFFAHEFELYSSSTAHTAYYDPIQKALIHYKVRRVLLANARIDGQMWSEYTTGVFGIEGKEGSFRDAEDGQLSGNPIEHGPADSVLGLYADYAPGEQKTIHYWIVAAKDIERAIELNNLVLEKKPEHMVLSTRNFWKSWVEKRTFHFPNLDPSCGRLFQKSLLLIRAHTNNNGAVIASSDSGMLQKGKDTYAYVWPRDAAFVALAMSGSGYLSITKEFFSFCKETISPMGYFMHKYNPDGSLGSSWHPWVRNGKFQLPIQKDETALVLFSFWKFYQFSKDLELVERFYDSLIFKTAEFLSEYKDGCTNLPAPSYDLWEERFGMHTFTSAAIYAGLKAAENFALLLGKDDERKRWHDRACEIREAILKHLYNEKTGTFYRSINVSYEKSDLRLEHPKIERDETIDISSAYGIYLFEVLNVNDPRLTSAMEKTKAALECKEKGTVGGLARYEEDQYHRASPYVPGNPWFITTLWYAQYTIARAKNAKDLEEAVKWLHWAADHAESSGVMAEQLHPYTGAAISATPLTWSHAEYVRTVLEYLNKMEELGLCADCNPNN